ncbi:unnamed protein product, partial [Rotaria magnacalcarata]
LTKVGPDAINVTRLNRKDGNIPTSTIKITFKDANNRNTFIHIGLQVDSMHFNAEAASQNKKPVQCYICLQYNHAAKYCKTKQQICANCGDSHRTEQCTAANDAIKFVKKIKKIEQTILSVETLINDDAASSSSFSDSDEDIQIVNEKNEKQPTTTNAKSKKHNTKLTTTSAATTAKPTTTTNTNTTSTQSSITTTDSDLNAKLSEMGSTKTNARGKQLQELLNEGLIEFVDDDSTTFEKNDYGTKLD